MKLDSRFRHASVRQLSESPIAVLRHQMWLLELVPHGNVSRLFTLGRDVGKSGRIARFTDCG